MIFKNVLTVDDQIDPPILVNITPGNAFALHRRSQHRLGDISKARLEIEL